jgi:hypothetical protein
MGEWRGRIVRENGVWRIVWEKGMREWCGNIVWENGMEKWCGRIVWENGVGI